MPGQFEDRYTAGGIRIGSRRGSAGAGPARPVPGVQYADQGGPFPVLPPLAGTRSLPPEAHHEPLTIVHLHSHSDGHGRLHAHMHAHDGDNRHTGSDVHPHTPGNPDSNMPSAGLASAGTGGETRGTGLEDVDLAGAFRAYFQSQGIDVAASLRQAQYAREHQAARARGRAARAQDLALGLRAARRKLAFEQRGFVAGAPGFGVGKIGEAQERVDALAAALAECCVNDEELISEANRRAAR